MSKSTRSTKKGRGITKDDFGGKSRDHVICALVMTMVFGVVGFVAMLGKGGWKIDGEFYIALVLLFVYLGTLALYLINVISCWEEKGD